MAAISDLVNKFDAARNALATALKTTGPQYMAGDGGTMWVFAADSSDMGFQMLKAAKASDTTVTFTSPPPIPPPMTT